MFSSFFPTPRLFFPAALVWTALGMALWYGAARDLGPDLSLGGLIGYPWPPAGASGADVAVETARNIWLFQYMAVVEAVFVLLVRWVLPHRWWLWSAGVSALIVFLLWFSVQLDVMINAWFGTFYNLLQQALGKPGTVTTGAVYDQVWTFGVIATTNIVTQVITAFIAAHWVFRWRTAMNDFYVGHWQRLRRIEGASQRIQEDTMRFAQTVEELGVSLVKALMTLVAFLPILWGLSSYVKDLPLVGQIPQALVFVAIIWATLGTAALAVAGIRLPGLEFRNQRVEAAFRKELVLGEDDPARAQPPTLSALFANVRQNYFRLYWNFTYFNVVRYAYLQASIPLPYFVLAPTIAAGGLTLGALQQIVRAFGRVEDSFQYLVRSWGTIVVLLSIYKRLRGFEATLSDRPLDLIEAEVVGTARTSP